MGYRSIEYITTVKNGCFCENELLSENDFEAVLVNFYCYDYGANVSETVQKISTRTLELFFLNRASLHARLNSH